MKVTIIGCGNMGRAIGTRAVAGGHDVELVDRDPADAQELAAQLGERVTVVPPGGSISGDVVVFAIYYGSLGEAAQQYRDQVGGRVVVEISNPVNFDTFDDLVVPAGSSAAEELANDLPDAHVVKAFNTAFATTLVAGEVAGEPLDVFIAGDDEGAKKKVAELVEGGGLRAIDVGPLRRARELERLGFLHISLQQPLGTGFASAVKLHW